MKTDKEKSFVFCNNSKKNRLGKTTMNWRELDELAVSWVPSVGDNVELQHMLIFTWDDFELINM